MTRFHGRPSELPQQGSPYWRDRRWWVAAGKTATGTAIATFLSVVGTVVAARSLGPSSYGTVVLALSLSAFVARLLDLTLEEGLVHHGARALERRDGTALRSILKAGLVVDALLGIGVFTLLLSVAGLLAGLLGETTIDPTLIRLAAVVPLVSTIDGTTGAILLLARRPDLRMWGLVSGAALRLATILAVAAVDGGAVGMILAFGAGAFGGSLVLGTLAWRVGWRTWRKELGPAARSEVNASSMALFRFAVYSTITTSISTVKGKLVPVLVGILSGPATIGLLEVAMVSVKIADSASTPIRMAIFPEQARLAAQGRLAVLRRGAVVYILAAASVGVIGGIIGWMLVPIIIPLLFSTSYSAAVMPARILIVAAWASLIVGWAKTLPAAVGKPGMRTVIAAVDLSITVVLVSLLAGFGVRGAAFAISASYLTALGLWLWLVRYLLAERPAGQAKTEAMMQPLKSDPARSESPYDPIDERPD